MTSRSRLSLHSRWITNSFLLILMKGAYNSRGHFIYDLLAIGRIYDFRTSVTGMSRGKSEPESNENIQSFFVSFFFYREWNGDLKKLPNIKMRTVSAKGLENTHTAVHEAEDEQGEDEDEEDEVSQD